jgi:hypothetical protein
MSDGGTPIKTRKTTAPLVAGFGALLPFVLHAPRRQWRAEVAG